MKIEPQNREFYLNPVAQLYLLADQLVKVLIAGRGFSKSFCNGISISQKVRDMPRSRGLLIGPTYTQLFANTLLPIKSALEWLGYYDRIHYVIGKVPPDYFEKAYHAPDKFENVITFWNGTTVILGSFDRPQLMRGGSNDWVIVDEAILINREKYDQVIIPTLRGSHPILRKCRRHRSQEFTSSMPRGVAGQWLLDYSAKAKKHPRDYFYIEGTSWDNIHVLGKETLISWKKDMEESAYNTEIMNKKRVKHGELFYPSLTDKHFYIESYDYDYIDSIKDISTSKRDCRWDIDCNTNKPLHLSFDFGAFNTLLVDQESKHNDRLQVNYLHHFYVSHPETIDDLVDRFNEYYQHMTTRILYIWGDKSGNKRMENSKLTMFDQVIDRLSSKGWRPVRKKTGDIEHLERHRFINVLLREEHPQLPIIRINHNNCKDLRIALEDAKMRNDKKDKRSEGNANVAQQHATHATDALDYRLYHAYRRLEKHGNKSTVHEVGWGS